MVFPPLSRRVFVLRLLIPNRLSHLSFFLPSLILTSACSLASRIATSNLRLLILPLPSLLYPWSSLSSLLPPLILPHITPDTLILLNQSDLVPPNLERAELEELVREKMLAVEGGEVRLPEGVRWWIGSLKTGEGMEEFLEEGVGRFVKER